MQIEFINKNSGTKYEIADGGIISMSYNEDLSVGTIIIRENTQIDIEPYDEVILYGLDYLDKYYMLIDTYKCVETRNRTSDKVYTYTITLMSQTKLLENKILPSLAISPSTNFGIFRDNEQPTIIDYLRLYNDLYGQKVRTPTGFENKFIFSNECSTKFADVCPELQFNNPTFRECLTQLMMVKNCIPIVQNNVIDYIDLSEKQGTQLDKTDSHIAFCETSQSSSDYISDLKMNIKNTIQETTIETKEYLGFRNLGEVNINSNSIKLYTQHPIYDIVEFKICLVGYVLIMPGSTGSTGKKREMYLERDITSWIKEKSNWDTLNIASIDDIVVNRRVTTRPVNPNLYGNYQNTCAYYTRGSNIIGNMNNVTQGPVGTGTPLIEYWYNAVLNDYGNEWKDAEGFETVESYYPINSGTTTFPAEPQKWRAIHFKIKYKTKADIVSNIGKSKIQTTEREVVDNQSENYVNAFTQGLLEYSKANRLGNKLKVYSARYERGYSDIPTIGRFFEGNEIIYKVDYQIYKNFVIATIYTCPNYVLRNYFTGVQSKLRSWKIVDGNEAFKREESLKIYCEFGLTQHNEKFNDYFTLANTNFISMCCGCFTDNILNTRYCLYSNSMSNTVPISGHVLENAKNVCGNSVIFTSGFIDNFYNNTFVQPNGLNDDGKKVVDGEYQKMLPYSGNLAVSKKLHLSLINRTVTFDDSFCVDGYVLGEGRFPDEEDSKKVGRIQMYDCQGDGGYSTDYFSHLLIKTYYKDSKEIPIFNQQFEFCTDNETEIVIGDEFMQGQISKFSNLTIYWFDKTVEPSKIKPSGGTMPILPLKDVTFINNYTALIKLIGVPNDKTYFIMHDNKVVLSFRNSKPEIYLNLLRKRNKGVYERVINNWIYKNTI